MSRSLKILLIVLGLGVFVFPKQIVFSQNKVESCTENTLNECCKKEKNASCHSENTKNNSDKNNCGDDCTQCHSCSVYSVMTYLSPESKTFFTEHFFIQKRSFEYGNSYFSFDFQNIWQPPKIG